MILLESYTGLPNDLGSVSTNISYNHNIGTTFEIVLACFHTLFLKAVSSWTIEAQLHDVYMKL